MATGAGASGSGLFKFMRPRSRPQPAVIGAAVGWGVAATASALWLIQPFDWLKKLFTEDPEPKK